MPELKDQSATQMTQVSDDDSSDGEFVSFLDRMKAERKEHRKSIEQLHRRRPSREDLITRGIYKTKSIDTVDLESKVFSLHTLYYRYL